MVSSDGPHHIFILVVFLFINQAFCAKLPEKQAYVATIGWDGMHDEHQQLQSVQS